MFDRKVEQPSFGVHDGATVKIFRHGIGIESRRHDHDSQIGPCPLQALQQRQREIAFEVALVKFIEHHGRHPLQERIRKQPPREYALSDESQPRATGNRFFKPDLISDSLSNWFAELPRHSTRRQPRRNPARLEYHHFAAHDTKQRGRYSSSLSRTRCGYDHKIRAQL